MKNIEFDPDLFKEIQSFPKNLRLLIGSSIQKTQEAFGNPHFHRGLGLRKLTFPYYEIRMGLHLRIIFKETNTSLYFIMMGNHDKVRKFLKN